MKRRPVLLIKLLQILLTLLPRILHSLSMKAGYGQIRPSPLLFNIFTTISGTQRIRVTEKLIIPSPQLRTQHMSGNSATRTLWSTSFTS